MQYVDLGNMPHKTKKKFDKKRLFKAGALTLLLAVVVYAGYVLYWPATTLLRQIFKEPGAVFSLITYPKGELKTVDGRTNFLLVGIDKRDNIPYTYTTSDGSVKQNSFLTDTIIVASVSKDKKNVSMISVPRDLWVTIPAVGKYKAHSSKINAVYSFGESAGYTGGGMALLENEVEDLLGVSIQYYGRIDFAGFKEAIDTLGGVDVVVDKTFDDYQYPVAGKESATCKGGGVACRYEHLHFDAGTNHMDGETALAFVRSRKGTNGEGSDFARARRQQKVIAAAKDKALKIDNFFDPVKLNNLFREFDQSIETDMDVSSIVGAYNLGKDLNIDKVNTLVLDNSPDNYLYNPPESQYGGAYVLIPKDPSLEQIHKAVDNLLNPSETAQTNGQ